MLDVTNYSQPKASIPQPRSVPALSRLSTSTEMRYVLQEQIGALQSINYKKFPEYAEGVRGMTANDFEEVKEGLYGLLEIYDER